MKLTLTAVLRKDKVNTSNQHPIVIRVSYANEKSRVGLGYSLEPSQWDIKLETPTISNKALRDEISQKIRDEKRRIEDTFRNYYQKEGEYPSHRELLSLLKENKERRHNPATFNQQLIKEYKTFIRERKINITTYKAYCSTLVKLEEFLESYRLGNYTEINDKFYYDFTSMLERQDYRGGTIGKYIKNIKAFLNHLAKQGKVIPAQYRDFKINKDYQTKPSLDLGDITLMKYALGLYKHSKLDKLGIPKLTQEEKNILIVYLWLCGTGQSFIDYKGITGNDIIQERDINGNETLTITYNRTKLDKTKEVIIVLTEDLLDLLLFYYNQFDYSNKLFNQVDTKIRKKVLATNKEYDGAGDYFLSVGKIYLLAEKFSGLEKQVSHYPYLLPQFSNQYFNRAIKEIAEKIGMKQKVSTSIKVGGRLSKSKGNRKCDLISSHLCRKYFIETQRGEGLGYEDIMARTGISSMNTLLIYNKISKENLIRNAISKPQQKANKGLIDNIAFNISNSKNNKKNTTPNRHSQINKKPTSKKVVFTLETGKKKK